MARVYFVREEISMEFPVGTSVLEAEIRAGTTSRAESETEMPLCCGI